MSPTYNNEKETKLYEIGRNEFDQEIIKNISKFLAPGRRFLEIGCGNGRFIKNLLAAGIDFLDIYGIDPDGNGIAVCKNTIDGLFIEAHFEGIDSSVPGFDYVACFQTIEHIEYLDFFINKMKEVLVDAGICFITVPNKQFDRCTDHIHFWDKDEFAAFLQPYFKEVNVGLIDKNQNILAVCVKKNGV